jgi:hypothetical protein
MIVPSEYGSYNTIAAALRACVNDQAGSASDWVYIPPDWVDPFANTPAEVADLINEVYSELPPFGQVFVPVFDARNGGTWFLNGLNMLGNNPSGTLVGNLTGNVTGNVTGNITPSGFTLAGLGQPQILAVVQTPSITTNQTAQVLADSLEAEHAGLFRINYQLLVVGTFGNDADPVTVTFGYTTIVGATTTAASTPNTIAGSHVEGSFLVQSTGAAFEYSVTSGTTFGTAAFYAVLERLD